MDVTNVSHSAGRANMATGTFTADGTVATVKLGFQPRYIRVINVTDAITHEKTADMDAGDALQTIANGTRTVENSLITIEEDGFDLAAAVAIDEKVINFIAMT